MFLHRNRSFNFVLKRFNFLNLLLWLSHWLIMRFLYTLNSSFFSLFLPLWSCTMQSIGLTLTELSPSTLCSSARREVELCLDSQGLVLSVRTFARRNRFIPLTDALSLKAFAPVVVMGKMRAHCSGLGNTAIC